MTMLNLHLFSFFNCCIYYLLV